jgi:hypothetical protein
MHREPQCCTRDARHMKRSSHIMCYPAAKVMCLSGHHIHLPKVRHVIGLLTGVEITDQGLGTYLVGPASRLMRVVVLSV